MQRSALLGSIIVSCRRHGKDSLAYLRDILSRLPRREAVFNKDRRSAAGRKAAGILTSFEVSTFP